MIFLINISEIRESQAVSDPVAKVVSVDYPTQINLGEEAEITIHVENQGGTANWQTISIAFPSNPSEAQVIDYNLDSARMWYSGEEMWFMYGGYRGELVYKLAEGSSENWAGGSSRWLKVGVLKEALEPT